MTMSTVSQSQPYRRSRTERMSAGVLGGLAHHLGADPTLVRAGYLALTILTAVIPAMVLYLALWALVPCEDD